VLSAAARAKLTRPAEIIDLNIFSFTVNEILSNKELNIGTPANG
jgi:hypothetical protein